jgi:hypothetical protein
MAAEDRRTWAPRSRVGYAVVLLGAALFVATCFLSYYGFPGGRSLSLYDQLLVAQDGGLEVGAILFLFGGVPAVLVVAIVGLTRGERQSGRLPRRRGLSVVSHVDRLTAKDRQLREETTIPQGLSSEAGFWLQAVSIGVAVIGTVLVATRRPGAHEHGLPSMGA